MPLANDWRVNTLLTSLPNVTLERWRPRMQSVELALGRVVCEATSVVHSVYFPTTAVVSIQVSAQGDTAEIGVVGSDGMVGISSLTGCRSGPSTAVVRSAGAAYRLPTAAILEELGQGDAAMHVLLRYMQAFTAQITLTAFCHRHHSIEQQVCRWVVVSLDRVHSNDLVITQELIGNLLGLRREAVAAVAARLRSAGLIRYSRGRITVLKRDALERRSCECYGAVKSEYERLLLRWS